MSGPQEHFMSFTVQDQKYFHKYLKIPAENTAASEHGDFHGNFNLL